MRCRKVQRALALLLAQVLVMLGQRGRPLRKLLGVEEIWSPWGLPR